MKRRELFKGIAGLFAAAPLAKLLPATNPPRPHWYSQTFFTHADMALPIELLQDELSRRYIEPAMVARLADSKYEFKG